MFNSWRARRSARRKQAWRYWRRQTRIGVLVEFIKAKESHRAPVRRTAAGQYEIPLPEDLSLEANYDEVMDAITQIRRYAVRERKRTYVDFRSVRTVGPGAALVLAAELDRWTRQTGRRLYIRDASDWDPSVYALFQEMGLYDLLRPLNRPRGKSAGTQQFIRFRANNRVLGDEARELRDQLAKLLRSGEFSRRRKLYEALVESMSNAWKHAYPAPFPKSLTPPLSQMWWMCGFLDKVNNILTILFFDQGVGIPTTVPRLYTLERLKGWLSSLGLHDDDSSRIKAAIEMGRT